MRNKYTEEERIMYYLGIDLGGTNAAAGVVNEDYQIIGKASVPTNAKDGVDAIVKNIVKAAKNAIAESGLTESDIASIGIGSPGAVDPEKGVVDFAGNLGFDHTPLAALVGEYFPGKKVLLENDANVAAYAEHMAGAAKGTKDSITITLGTGVGGGMVINGRIYSGFNNKGAEFGHIVIERDGWECSCGRRGCWEAYASVSGLIRLTKQEMLRDKGSVMWEIAGGSLDNVNGLTSFDAMRRGDHTAVYVVESYLRSVAAGLINVINILQPEVICIGGGISKEGDYLLKPIQEIVNSEMFAKRSDTFTQVRIAKLGNDAGIIGAALLNA